MVGLIILSVILSTILWIIITPMMIVVDTRDQSYYIQLKGLCKIWPSITEGDLVIHFKLLFYQFTFNPFTKKKKRSKRKTTKPTSIPAGKRLHNVIRSFQVVTLHLVFDTDDYCLNAQLVPVSTLISLTSKLDTNINFMGESYLLMKIRNRLWRVLFAYLELKKY